MHIHLLIPNLFWPHISIKEIIKNVSLPALETMLIKSQLSQQPSEGIEAWLCECLFETAEDTSPSPDNRIRRTRDVLV